MVGGRGRDRFTWLPPETIPFGSTFNLINKTTFATKKQQIRVAAEIRHIARTMTEWKILGHDMLHEFLNLASEAFLVANNFAVQGANPDPLNPNQIGQLPVDLDLYVPLGQPHPNGPRDYLPKNTPALPITSGAGPNSRLNTTLCGRVARLILNDFQGPATDNLQDGWIHSLRPSLAKANINFPLIPVFPRPLQRGNRLLNCKFDLRALRQPPRGVLWSQAVGNVETTLLSNTRSHITQNLESAIAKTLEAMFDQLHQPRATIDLITKLAIAYTSPFFVNHCRTTHNIGLQHPMFCDNAGALLPVFNLALRMEIVSLLTPIFIMLDFAIPAVHAGLAALPAPAANYANAWQAKQAAGLFGTWTGAVKGNHEMQERAVPVLYYLSAVYRDLKSIGGQLPADYKAIHISPVKSKCTPDMQMFTWPIISKILIPGLMHDRRNMRAIAQNQLEVPRSSVPNAPFELPRHDADFWVRRQTIGHLFDLSGKKQLVAAANGHRGHQMRFRSQIVDVGNLMILADGSGTRLMWELRIDPDLSALHPELLIKRIKTAEEVVHEKPVPNPTTAFPGTTATGYLNALNRRPILSPAIHLAGRVISIDPNQRNAIYAVTADRVQARSDYADDLDLARMEFEDGDINQQEFVEQTNAAKAEFEGTAFVIRGRHDRDRNLSTWKEKKEASARAADAALRGQPEFQDIQTHIDARRGAEAHLHGSDARHRAHYRSIKYEHHKSIAKWDKKQNSAKDRFTMDRTRQSYDDRKANYIMGNIDKESFLQQKKRIAIKMPNPERAEVLEERKRTDTPIQKPDPPVIPYGYGQGSQWARGHGPVKNVSFARKLAIRGATIIMMPEKGTSSKCPQSLGSVEQGLPPPVNPADPLSGLPQPHDLVQVSLARHWCNDPNHERFRRGQGGRTGRRGGRGHRGMTSFCRDINTGHVTRTSAHAPLRVKEQVRLLACPHGRNCAPPDPPAQSIPRRMQVTPTANLPRNGRIGSLFERDNVGAHDMRHPYFTYGYSAGHRPGWNRNAHVVPPPLHRWQNWIDDHLA